MERGRLALLLPALALLAACAGGPDPEEMGLSHMYVHYEQVGEILNAVIDGDVDATRSPARWLATHQDIDYGPAGAEATERMRNEARIIAEQRRIQEIGYSTARLGTACGACHTSVGGGPRISVGEPPPSSRMPGPSMQRHAWGSDRLWEGLIGPSNAAWRAGAGALSSMPLDFGANDQASRLAKRVQELSGAALEAETPAQRAQVFGQFLETCATCHGALGLRMRMK